jgi:hypothetical protein
MATGLAVLMTCLYTACGGGNGAHGVDPLSFFADTGADPDSGTLVAAADTAVMPAAGGHKTASGVPPGHSRSEGTPPPSTRASIEDPAPAADPLMLVVDLSKIPPPGAGSSALKVAPTSEIAPAGGGEFRTVCTFSHMSFDDPIVFPGQPGRSHLHTFFGNTGVNANSTAESISGTGNSTCRGGIANRSSYWVPTLIDTKDNTPIKPGKIMVYYKAGLLPASKVQPLPAGLRIIAGDPNAKGPHPEVFSSRWKCIGGPKNQNGLYQASIGNCDVGASLYQEVFFPQCWDGVNLDSPDHKSHMSYTVMVPNQTGSRESRRRECPSTHPVILPLISYNVTYVVYEKDAPLRWRLSSDMYDRSLPGGYSSHGDWFNGWKTDISDAFVRHCIEVQKDCHAHLLGDGRKIF